MRIAPIVLCLVLATFGETQAQEGAQSVELEGRRFVLRVQDGELRSGPLREVLGPNVTDLEEIRVVGVSAQQQLALISAGTRRVLLRRRGARLRTVWSGDVAWRGDPGERTRDVVLIADQNADGFDDIVVGRHAEGRSICGQDTTLLEPRAFHGPSGTLVSVTLRRLPEGGASLRATGSSPGPTGPPVAPLLRARSASSGAAGPPVQIVDGSDTTGWVETAAGDGRWEFVTLALDGGLALRALRIAPLPIASMPRGIWIVGEEAQVYAALPATAAGQPLWVDLTTPIEGSCVSVVLDAAPGPHAGLGELTGYSDLDFGGGVDALVGRFARSASEGRAAAQVLARMGGAAANAILRAYPDMPQRERQLAVDVLLHIEGEAATGGLRRAALDPALQERVVTGLRERADLVRLTGLSREPYVAGAEGEQAGHLVSGAVYALATLDASAALEPTLAAYGRGHRSTLLGRALGRVIREGHDDGIIEWAAGTSNQAVGRVSAAIARARPDSPALVALLGHAQAAETFEERYLFLAAADESDASVRGALQPWLETQMDADEWMLRFAALRSLAPNDSRSYFEAALRDPYPRVRALAAKMSAGTTWARDRIAELATDDPWALVRAQALVSSADRTPNRWTARGLNDAHESVRAAAIGLQAELSAPMNPEVVERINRRLADDDEWPVVLQAGVELARARCEPGLVPGLEAIIERGLRGGAWAPDVEVASSAVVALAAIGSPNATELVQRIAAGPQGPVQRVAAGAESVESCAQDAGQAASEP